MYKYDRHRRAYVSRGDAIVEGLKGFGAIAIVFSFVYFLFWIG